MSETGEKEKMRAAAESEINSLLTETEALDACFLEFEATRKGSIVSLPPQERRKFRFPQKEQEKFLRLLNIVSILTNRHKESLEYFPDLTPSIKDLKDKANKVLQRAIFLTETEQDRNDRLKERPRKGHVLEQK